MDNEKMGAFIAELRKEKGLTQKQLAAKMNITDKAVSKWERCLSLPDITLLVPLAQELGVSVGELLDGEKEKSDMNDIENTIDYADKAMKNKVKAFRILTAIIFTAVLLVGIIVCGICDLAVSGGFTWSLFPVSSAVFAWLLFFPVIKLWAKGIPVSLAALTVFAVPFLAVMGALTRSDVLTVGIPVSLITVAYLWGVFALFKLMKGRKHLAAAVSLLAVIPVCLLINLVIAQALSQPFIDMWDVLAFAVIAAVAAVLFVIDFNRKGKLP